METPDTVQALMIMLAGIQTIYYYHLMPPIVASHFNAAGAPNGWSAKSSIFILYWIVIGVAVLVAQAIPVLTGALPPSMVNLPKKDYWMTDENWPRAKAMLKTYSKWFGAILLFFLLIVFELVFRINLTHDPVLGNYFWMVLVLFFVLVIGWSIRFVTRFLQTD